MNTLKQEPTKTNKLRVQKVPYTSKIWAVKVFKKLLTNVQKKTQYAIQNWNASGELKSTLFQVQRIIARFASSLVNAMFTTAHRSDVSNYLVSSAAASAIAQAWSSVPEVCYTNNNRLWGHYWKLCPRSLVNIAQKARGNIFPTEGEQLPLMTDDAMQ